MTMTTTAASTSRASAFACKFAIVLARQAQADPPGNEGHQALLDAAKSAREAARRLYRVAEAVIDGPPPYPRRNFATFMDLIESEGPESEGPERADAVWADAAKAANEAWWDAWCVDEPVVWEAPRLNPCASSPETPPNIESKG